MPGRNQKGFTENKTKRFVVVGIFLSLAIFILFLFSLQKINAATAPAIINYQGKLLVSGKPATTTQSMYFILYDSVSGGSALYTASGTLGSPQPLDIIPNQGLFSIELGDSGSNTLDQTIFRDNGAVYIEVRVGAQTLSPRKRITSAPFAFTARYLDGYSVSTGTPSNSYIPVADSSGNFAFNHVTSTGLNVTGTSTFSSITLGGVNRTTWPTGGSASGTYFVGLTATSTYDGVFSFVQGTTTYHGYQAGNRICNVAYSGSHFCRTDEIVATIADLDITSLFVDSASGWIAEGPPGYTANSNDCNGWMSNSTGMLGAFWLFNTDGGGAGWLVNCSVQKAISCCK